MEDNLRIPKQIEQAIIRFRLTIHQQNETSKSLNTKNPGQGMFVTKPLELSQEERQFWTIADDNKLTECLFEIQSAMAIGFPLDQLSSLPEGYILLLFVLGFEDDCQFSGWGAVSNAGPEKMNAIIGCYEAFGLEDESAALAAGLAAYEQSAGNQEAFGAAYSAMPNATPDMKDRLSVILDVVRSEPELFGL